MLTLLHIENVAVIEKAEIEFGAGLNVLTGETGAGKSIVIDALEAALGWRTSREIVRLGAPGASVTAAFTPEGAEEWLAENGIDGGDELLLSRRLGADGKSACRVNGAPVSASQLRELGLRLIDIHGQGDGQRLAAERWHREYLDGFAGLDAELSAYREAYRAYAAAKDELESLGMDESEKARRVDLLTYQICELEQAQIAPGELEEKTKRREFLRSAGKLTEAVESAFAALDGGESSLGALSLIEEAGSAAESGARCSDELSGIAGKLRDLRYSAEDVLGDLRELRDRLDFSPGELDELDARLDALRRVLRKYGGTEEAAAEYLEKCRAELDGIGSSEERMKKLTAEAEARRAAAQKLADALSEKRRRAGGELSRRIEKELTDLSMRGARFGAELKKIPLGPYGCDDVAFSIAANTGEAMGRISKAASGGELSRIMLAMKTVLTAGDPVSAMVFDEIDAGISGVAAQRVAEKLAGISRKKQVICVTHLPQIAAMGDEQFSIEKRAEGGRTYTYVNQLDGEGRRRELARLTGGENVTETTLAAAAEQLAAAERFKAALR